MQEIQSVQQWIVAIISLLVSLALFIVPGIKEKWASLPSLTKAQIIIAVCVGLAIVSVLLACLNVLVAPDAYCPDFTDLTVVFNAFYALVQTALVAAGAVQTLYAVALKPISNYLEARAFNSGFYHRK